MSRSRKKVLEKIRQNNNLTLLKVDCWNGDEDFDRRCEKSYTSIEELDFEYDDRCCIQQLYGIAYCVDKTTG